MQARFFFFCAQATAQTAGKNKTAQTYLPGTPTQNELAKIKAANIKKAAATQFQYFVIKVNNNSFGYSIYADGNLYIQQNTIPAITGTKGFEDTASAAKTARLVIEKIKQGEIPPTITIHDLKKIGLH
ncbi:MAG: DUF4907 domain-containing protein [Chitinophagaceae bacterium]|nr:DUF4907 domain-containing protein [Chitinophagaceae bacterium]